MSLKGQPASRQIWQEEMLIKNNRKHEKRAKKKIGKTQTKKKKKRIKFEIRNFAPLIVPVF